MERSGPRQMTVPLPERRRAKSAPVGVVGKVIQILEQLDLAPGGLLLREVAARTEINKSTAYRFLSHLESVGYVFRDSDGYYFVGPRLAKLGTRSTYHAALCRASAGVLDRLRIETGETVNLAILDRNEILYLCAFESPHTFRMASEVGMRRPLYCTALGKAILAHLPPALQRKMIASTMFERFTPQTICDEEELQRDLVKTRKRGYAIDDEEAVVGARCIAVAILDADHQVVGGMSVSAPVVRVAKKQIVLFAEKLRAAAGEITRHLSGLSE